MKIRCEKCGKRFDPEIYSGLCPKCGAYNGKRVDDSQIAQYLSSGYQGEELHRELHEAYDGGYEAAHGKAQEGRQSFSSERAGEAEPLFQEGKYALPERKRRPVLTGLLLLGLILMPVLTFFLYKTYESGLYRQLQDGTIAEMGPSADGTLTMAVETEDPSSGSSARDLRFTLLEAGPVPQYQEMFPDGTGLYGVKVGAFCDGWPFGVSWGDVFLTYELDGETVYRAPLEGEIGSWFIGYGLSSEDILSSWCPGLGEYEEGYLFFRYDAGARDMSLLWTVSGIQAPKEVIAEGRLPLEGAPGLSFLEEGE